MATRKRRRSKLEPFIVQLGIVPDTELAKLAGVTVQNVRVYRKRRGIPARWRGEGDQAAESQAPAARPTGQPRQRRRRKSKLDPYLDQLGVLPDQEVAELAGVTLGNVRAYRYRHGIASPRLGAVVTGARVQPIAEPAPTSAPEITTAEPAQEAPAFAASAAEAEPATAPPAAAVLEPQPVAPAVAPAERPTKAFRVKVEGIGGTVAYVVIAENIAEAASKALRTLEQRRVEGEVLSVDYLAVALQQ